MSEQKHIPVLLQKILQFFENKKISVFFDGTLGAAGHAEAILKHHPEIEAFLGCDQDYQAIDLAKKNLSAWKDKVFFFHGNFSLIEEFLKEVGRDKLDGALLDIGISSMQIDTPERGFSFQRNGPLDMRMDQSSRLTAEEVVNRFPEKILGEIFRDLGEEPRWRQAAKEIVKRRKEKKIKTTEDLIQVLYPVLRKPKKIHPLTLVFQALRIYVNGELEALKTSLPLIMNHLNDQGRLAVISFHSLEDRIVKNVFRDSPKTSWHVITKKPLEAQEEEKRKNPRSRSAKLRVIEKVGE
jgi:16S rRNA (cytosine1402-N4)-methyltransferase